MKIRNRKITVRLSEKERQYLGEQADAGGMKIEPYVRELIMGNEVKSRPKEEWAEVVRQVAAVGNNTFGVLVGHGGGARSQYSYCRKISWAEAQPGDFVFYPDLGHVGIVAGYDGEGNVLIVHCSLNGVVVTGRVGFTLVGRPEVF